MLGRRLERWANFVLYILNPQSDLLTVYIFTNIGILQNDLYVGKLGWK